jgi:hypothetical protein
MGVGAPPSAKEEIDTALRSTRVTTIKRTIFFIGRILRGIAPTRAPPYFFRGRKSEVFEKLVVENWRPSVYRQNIFTD